MRSWNWSIRVAAVIGMAVMVLLPALAVGQDRAVQKVERAGPKRLPTAASGETVQSIDDDFNRELLQLERRRLERLGQLAAQQGPGEAAATYEQLFRLAIAGDLFRDAESAAVTVLTRGSPSAMTTGLAHLVKIIAEADRGAFEQSVESLRQAIAERAKAAKSGAPPAGLSTSEIVELCDAYYQRLIHAARFDEARNAFQMVMQHTQRPVVKEFASSRLKRLNMVGKPAPPIQGTDVDGKVFNLADARGKVVLVVFWASWCPPCAAEIETLQQAADTFQRQGFQVLGINLDGSPDAGRKPEAALPEVRRFLLDHNVTWPTLISGRGDKDYARVYNVTEVPANLLIAKNGTIAQIDLVPRNLEAAIARAVAE